MTAFTFHPTEVRVTRLDAAGQPVGPTLTIKEFSMTTTDPTTNNRSRPTKAQLAELEAERDSLRAFAERRTTEAGAAEQRANDLAAELTALDPEARLVADLEAAVATFHRRLAEEAERAAEARRRRSSSSHDFIEAAWGSQPGRPTEPYQPALQSALGRSILHLAARHEVPVEATTIYPPPPGPTLAAVPPELGRSLEHLMQQGGWR